MSLVTELLEKRDRLDLEIKLATQRMISEAKYKRLDSVITNKGCQVIIGDAVVRGGKLMYRLTNDEYIEQDSILRLDDGSIPADLILPCGCSAFGDPVYWNKYNRVVQCHRCGLTYKPEFPNDD